MDSWRWLVYILECEDKSYYTGMTWRSDLRFEQHLSGLGAKYTEKHKPKKLIYLEEHDDLESARMRERQIKGWVRKKKEKLIKGEWSQRW